MPGTINHKAQALTRRRVLLTGAGAAAAGSLLLLRKPGWAQLLADVPPGGIRFDVLRGDRVVGRHEVDFRVTDRRLQVETRIDVVVSVLAVVVFRYRHLGIETYVGDQLVRFESETDDDGARFRVLGDARPDGFAISTAKGMVMAPSDILVGSYWTPRVIERRLLIDPKRGRVKAQVVAGRERITVPVQTTTREATRYRVSGIITGSVTYDDDGRWIAASLVSKGSEIVYRLRG